MAPFTGTFRPEGVLRSLIGKDMQGTWSLEIGDDAGGDTGTLNSWSLTITGTAGGSSVRTTDQGGAKGRHKGTVAGGQEPAEGGGGRQHGRPEKRSRRKGG